jgi:hypothetical protein
MSDNYNEMEKWMATWSPAAAARDYRMRMDGIERPTVRWVSILEEGPPPPFHTVLTIHQGDLYPVCAAYYGDTIDPARAWLRATEGPEDVCSWEEAAPGWMLPLLRPPTHWCLVPRGPEISS